MFGESVILIIIFLIAVILYIYLYRCKNIEGMINIPTTVKNPTWNRNGCQYDLGKTLETVLQKHGIRKTRFNLNSNAALLVPCSYDNTSKEINNFYARYKHNKFRIAKNRWARQKINDPNEDIQRVYVIHNADIYAGKDYLWHALVLFYGVDGAKTLTPNTYITYLPKSMARFKKEYKEGNIYIMKKNIQRQEGLKISDSYDDIIKHKSSYVVIQELLQDPYTIDNRKINLRMYVLIVCQNNNTDIYVYNDGFMYYTKEPFVPGSLAFGPNVTTGYIERSVYEKNPLTHQDFRKYLDNKDRVLSVQEEVLKNAGLPLSKIVFGRINNLLSKVFMAGVSRICNDRKIKSAISFQMFGVDIAINDNLWPSIMEINKGPDMGAKDERDKELKIKCTEDTLRIVGLIPQTTDNGYIRIIDKTNGVAESLSPNTWPFGV